MSCLKRKRGDVDDVETFFSEAFCTETDSLGERMKPFVSFIDVDPNVSGPEVPTPRQYKDFINSITKRDVKKATVQEADMFYNLVWGTKEDKGHMHVTLAKHYHFELLQALALAIRLALVASPYNIFISERMEEYHLDDLDCLLSLREVEKLRDVGFLNKKGKFVVSEDRKKSRKCFEYEDEKGDDDEYEDFQLIIDKHETKMRGYWF